MRSFMIVMTGVALILVGLIVYLKILNSRQLVVNTDPQRFVQTSSRPAVVNAKPSSNGMVRATGRVKVTMED